MSARPRAALLLAALLVTGCPRSPDPAAPPSAPAAPPPAAQGGGRPDAAPGPPSDPSAPATPPGEAATPAPPGAAAPVAPPAAGSPTEAQGGEPGPDQTLAIGQLLRPADEVSLGLVRLTRQGERDAARLSVGSGQLSFQVELVPGQRVEVGPGAYRLVAVDAAAGTATVRALASVPRDADLVEPAPRGGDPGLPGMGLYRLPGGEVIGVGNVVESDQGLSVWLAVYPPGYAEQPMQDYDLHPRARAGQRLDGRVRPLTLERLEAPSVAAPRGLVVLGGTG